MVYKGVAASSCFMEVKAFQHPTKDIRYPSIHWNNEKFCDMTCADARKLALELLDLADELEAR